MKSIFNLFFTSYYYLTKRYHNSWESWPESGALWLLTFSLIHMNIGSVLILASYFAHLSFTIYVLLSIQFLLVYMLNIIIIKTRKYRKIVEKESIKRKWSPKKYSNFAIFHMALSIGLFVFCIYIRITFFQSIAIV
jgi:hypothetical protein